MLAIPPPRRVPFARRRSIPKTFFDRYAGRIHKQLAGIGASFQDLSEEPERIFLDLGFRQTGSWATVEAAKRFGSLPIPWFVLRTVLRTLATQYRVHRFEAPR